MEEEVYTVRLIGDGVQEQEGTFTLFERGERCLLVLKLDDQYLEAEGADYFEALCRIREKLVPFGLQPHCYGASRNVFPSGMVRDMGSGIRAYKLTIGQSARLKDLVDIFESGDDIEVVTVAEQKVFFDKWFYGIVHREQ